MTMTKTFTKRPFKLTPIDAFLSGIKNLMSDRKVRPVVTRSGKRARGNFPSIKAPQRCRYESIVERDFLRILEVSSLVKQVASHPYVLALRSPNVGDFHYTPDVETRLIEHAVLFEVKGSYFLETYDQRQKLRAIVNALNAAHIHFALVLDSEVQSPGLQEELEELLNARPVVGHYRARLNKDPFDPLGRSVKNTEMEARWQSAQAECDALLTRLMRRDPSDLLPIEQH